MQGWQNKPVLSSASCLPIWGDPREMETEWSCHSLIARDTDLESQQEAVEDHSGMKAHSIYSVVGLELGSWLPGYHA